MKPDLAKTILRRSRRIEGWFEDEAAMLFALIDEIQKEQCITGDIFEIGTHHGRSAVFLAAMADATRERLCLCDLFGDQAANISASGSGDLAILDRNLSMARDVGLQVSIFQQNSTEITVEEIGGPYRFFHIDGGHNLEEALSDLHLAAGALHPQGIIALDDPFQSGWPGVTEALLRFLDQNQKFRAIVVGFNKLLFVHEDYATLYQEEMRKPERRGYYHIGSPWEMKELPFHGHSMQILYLPAFLQEHRLTFAIRKFYRSHDLLRNPVFTPIGSLLKKIIQLREPK